MSLGDDLERLDDLRRRGVLTEDEFTRAKARVLEARDTAAGVPPRPGAGGAGYAGTGSGAPAIDAVNGLQRTLLDRWVGGVCGGIARSLGLASWAVRLTFVLMVLCAGTGVLLYVLLWIFVPLEQPRIGYMHA